MATTLSVLTWNLYLGANVRRVLGGPPEALPAATDGLWHMVQATDFPARAELLARAIARLRPDILLLQEAARWSDAVAPGAAPGQRLDWIELLQGASSRRDLAYRLAVRSMASDVVLPRSAGPSLRFEDSVAILVREAPDGEPVFGWAGARSGCFAAKLPAEIGGRPFPVRRAFAAIDLALGAQRLRVATAHLEFFGAAIRRSQAAELLDGVAGGDLPAVIGGDFNGMPGSPVWAELARRGWRDAWFEARQDAGPTSPFAEDVRDPRVGLDERIDWIALRGPLAIAEITRIGHGEEDRGEGGLRPSDHAGVFARCLVTGA
jgi:endonuclease/exonuclease/phosphatase family metal-dependent hydrolase